MCGIVLVKRHDGLPAHKMVMKRFENQKSRGTQGFGYIAIDKQNIFSSWYQSQGQSGIEKAIDKDTSPTILFHHRFPTSTPNMVEATHPIAVRNKKLQFDYYVVHNGIIQNDEELKEKHNKDGYEYTTEIEKIVRGKKTEFTDIVFNDSEAFAIELALTLEGKQEKINARGSIAFIALQVNKKTQATENILFGRNFSNPLKLHKTDGFFCLTSEGHGESIKPNVVYVYDMAKATFTEVPCPVGESMSAVDLHSETYNYKKIGYNTTYGKDEDEYDRYYAEREAGKDMLKLKQPEDDTDGEFSSGTSYDDYLLDLWEEEAVLERKLQQANTKMELAEVSRISQELEELKKKIIVTEKLMEEESMQKEMEWENRATSQAEALHKEIEEIQDSLTLG